MTPAGSNGDAPLLVLGLGNILLADDGVGVVMLERLRATVDDAGGAIDWLDGGTQGLALIPWSAGRVALLILDAVALGAEPGTIHVLDDPMSLVASRGITAHESNAGSLIGALELLGERPARVMVVGIEPAEIETRIGLSKPVAASVPRAVLRAERIVAAMCEPACARG